MKLEILFPNPFRVKIETVGTAEIGAINLKLDAIHNRLKTMPTNADLTTALQEVEAAPTTEIEQIVAKLAENGVSQENLDLVRGLKTRISGIIADAPPEA